MTGALIMSRHPVVDFEAATKKYVDDTIASDGMLKSVYDQNDNGIVDLSEDSEKLGGELPTFYATTLDLQDKIDRNGDIMMGSLVIRGGLNVESTTDLYNAELRKTLIKSYSNIAKIDFEDTKYPNTTPGLWWDSSDQNLKVEIHTGNSYKLWHAGNFSPNTLNPITRKTFIGDGTTTVFSTGTYTQYNADVFYNGVRLFEPEDVDLSSGIDIVFTVAPEIDDRIDFVGYNNPLI
jgi:hypothetical protein